MPRGASQRGDEFGANLVDCACSMKYRIIRLSRVQRDGHPHHPYVRNARPSVSVSGVPPLGGRPPRTPVRVGWSRVYAIYLPSRRFLSLQHMYCNPKGTLHDPVHPDGTFHHDGGALSRGRRPASIGSRYRPEQECATPRHSPPPILLALLPSPSPTESRYFNYAWESRGLRTGDGGRGAVLGGRGSIAARQCLLDPTWPLPFTHAQTLPSLTR